MKTKYYDQLDFLRNVSQSKQGEEYVDSRLTLEKLQHHGIDFKI